MRLLLLLSIILLAGCTTSSPTKSGEKSASGTAAAVYTGKIPIDKIKLPPGFHISVFAENVKSAREICRGTKGTIFVGSRDAGSVFALVDTNGDYVADKQYTLLSGLSMPVGVAFRNGSLFISDISKILRLDDIENRLETPPAPVTVYDQYPKDEHHGWKFIAFGPDGKLYVPVGAPCNVCEPERPIYATITRMDVDHPGTPEIVQTGIRNTVGFTWHPTTKEIWFTDNGRDWLGEDIPSCELNHATAVGQNFGFPYCHQGDISDPKFGDKHACSEFVPPVQKLGAHVAPLGLDFYTGNMFPASYKNQLFIAEHGSWNREKKSGYNISVVRLDDKGNSIGYETFAEGFLLPDETVWGRPVDVEQMPDGSLLVSDDYANAIYRITWTGKN